MPLTSLIWIVIITSTTGRPSEKPCASSWTPLLVNVSVTSSSPSGLTVLTETIDMPIKTPSSSTLT